MLRGYYFLLGVSFLLACVTAIRDLASAILMLTLGLGAPIIFAASIFVYALCLMPAILARRDLAHRAAGVALSLMLVGAVAYAPGASGRRQAEEFATAQQTGDRLPAQPIAATSLEIRRPSNQYDDAFQDREACGKECRIAALYGGLKWVRVVMRDKRPRYEESTTTFYSVERGDKCAGLTAAPADAPCVVMAPDNHEVADLTLDLTVERPPGARRAFALMRAKTIKRIIARRANDAPETLRQTEVDFDIAATPTILAPRFMGINSSGVEIVTREWRANRITLQDTLSKLGFPTTPPAGAPPMEQKPTGWRSGVNDMLTRELVAVLDLPQQEPFNAQQGQIVSDWVMHARATLDWTPQMIALLRRLVRDDRIRTPTFFDQIFERHAAVTAALMPDILDALTRAAADRGVARNAAYTFPRLDPALLKPHAAKILALIDTNADLRSLLLPAVGRLGVDPAPYLLPLDPMAARDYDRKLQGACRAEAQWAAKLVGPLKENLAASDPNKRDHRRLLVAALVNLGERDFVTQTLDAANRDDARLLRRIESVLTSRRYRSASMCDML